MEVRDRKKAFAKAVIRWGEKNLRAFPWRDDTSPFKVFIAEILLKRTTSTAVKRVYPQFLNRFPDISSLAAAKLGDIEEVLKPIGLYKQRSIGLKEAVEYITAHYGSRLPSTYEDLLKIPYVGSYTAGAIASFGFGKPVPILDSNVRRVVKRAFKDVIGDKASDRDMIEVLKDIISKEKPKLFNWSLIDIGSQVCSYRSMKCDGCPLERICCYEHNTTSDKKVLKH
jgi:A/G-specific adenine glycosylase